MTWWMRLNGFLNARRLTYAWIAGGALWFAWLLSILLGPGNMDAAGQVIGTDYLQFYSAGTTLIQGHSADLYNFAYQSQLEQSIAGPGLRSFHAFLTPPFLAWLYIPFSLLPYTWSFIAWSLFGFLFLWISVKLLSTERPFKNLLWSLTWFPIFASISFGQNSLLSLLLFSLTYWLWKKEKYFAAGLVSSLILFKPQLVLGLGLLWLLEWRKSWKSLLGLALGGATLAGLCFWLLPDASRVYIEIARNFLPGMIYQKDFPIWHMDSLRGFWILLFPGQVWLVESLSLLLSIAGIVVFIVFWRQKRSKKDLLFAGIICLTIWITPHAMIYDWSILLIPAILLWQVLPQLRDLWKPLFALIWIATFLSGPSSILQLKILPIAIQVSIPVLFIVYLTAFQKIRDCERNNAYIEVAKP
jgi:alpha-1,2-mannosyltransferase